MHRCATAKLLVRDAEESGVHFQGTEESPFQLGPLGMEQSRSVGRQSRGVSEQVLGRDLAVGRNEFCARAGWEPGKFATITLGFLNSGM